MKKKYLDNEHVTHNSTFGEEDDIEENVTVNPVIEIVIHHQQPGKRKLVRNISYPIMEGPITQVTNNLSKFCKKENQNHIKVSPSEPEVGRLQIRNSIRHAPVVKQGTLAVGQILRLAKTDGVVFNLSNVRSERTGTLESRYETLYILGSGAYGEVRKIRDRITDDIKAVKLISKEKCRTVEKLNEEIEILKKLVSYITK